MGSAQLSDRIVMMYEYVKFCWPDGSMERHVRSGAVVGAKATLCGRERRRPALPKATNVYTIRPGTLLFGDACPECIRLSRAMRLPWEFAAAETSVLPSWKDA